MPDPRGRARRAGRLGLRRAGRDLTLIGVTGTNGKTTTAYLLEAGLRAGGRRTGLVGTIETRIGDEVLTERADDAGGARPAGAARRDARARGRRGRDGGLQPRAGAGPGRRHDVRRRRSSPTSARTTSTSTPTSRTTSRPRRRCSPRSGPGLGVVNVDDPYGRRLVAPRDGAGGDRTRRRADAADWRAEDVAWRCTRTGARFALPARTAWRCRCASALPGEFNVANAALRRGRAGAARALQPERPRPASRPCPACPAGWSGSPLGSRSARAGRLRAHPRRVERLLAARARGHCRRRIVSSCSAAAATATRRSGPRWVRSPCAGPTSRCSPATTRARRTRCASSPRCRRGADDVLRRRTRLRSSSSPTGAAAIRPRPSLRRPGRRPGRRGQGPRDRPGDRRRRAPVRRPGRCCAALMDCGRSRMIRTC